MSRRSFGPFSGAQLTAIILTFMVVAGVPGTVWAVDTFQNVAIEDPTTGVKASVDSHHQLEALAALEPGSVTTDTTPANLVRFAGGNFEAGGGCTKAYTTPAGDALILKGATGFLLPDNTGYAETDLFSDSSCTDWIGGFEANQPHQTVNQDFGSGIALRRGVWAKAFGGGGTVLGYGYLVPRSSVPSAAATTVGPRVPHGARP